MGRIIAVAAVLVVVVGCEKGSSRSPQSSAEQTTASASHDAAVGTAPSGSAIQRIDVAASAGERTSHRDIVQYLVPNADGDVPNGWRVYQVSELGQRYGIRDKDILIAVNGLNLGVVDRSLLVLQMVADDSRITLDIRRDGQPLRLEYELVGGTVAELLDLEDFVGVPQPPPQGELEDLALMYVSRADAGEYRVEYPLVSMVRGQMSGYLRQLEPGDVAGGVTVGTAGPLYEKLGIESGDVITAFGGVSLTDRNRVLDAWYLLGQEDELVLDLVRAGKPMTLRYQLIGRPASAN